MTINDAITQIQTLKPHQYDDEMIVGWLYALDCYLFHELISWHSDSPETPPKPYSVVQDGDKELFAADPYSDVYLKYLSAQIDFYNGEMARYNNSMIMYNIAYSAFADWYTRGHMPKQDNFVKV